MSLVGEGDRRRRRSPWTLFSLGGIAILLFAGLLALGIWQLERRVWKLDLIAKIDQRIHATPVDAPGPSEWPGIDASRDAYRRVRAEGTYIPDRDTLVQATTALGGGYWVMTPLHTDAGFTVLINRGFIPGDDKDKPLPNMGGRVQVTGLLRVTEPKGGFLRNNDPAAGRWHSRDVAAIAQARGLAEVAPYFIDADAVPGAPAPVGGLTVVTLPNSHLVYAFTWFTLAAMLAGAAVHVARAEWRGRNSTSPRAGVT